MKILNSIEIKTTPEKIFYWLEEPARAMEWMTSVTKTEFINKTPNMIGTTFREIIEENGRETEMRGVIIDFNKNKNITFKLDGNFNTVEVSFALIEKEGITVLIQNAEVHFKGIMKIVTVIFGSLIKKKILSQSQKEFQKSKDICEN
jgi:carbon monoxide dehydrogenase subunit G